MKKTTSKQINKKASEKTKKKTYITTNQIIKRVRALTFRDGISDQLAAKLNNMRMHRMMSIPEVGWIKYLRLVFSMPSRHLAGKMSITQARLSSLEKAEANKNTTLKSLEKAANALECDLYYCFVPRQSVDEFMRKNAEERAKKGVKNIKKNKTSEFRPKSAEDQEKLYKSLVNALLQRPKKIWG